MISSVYPVTADIYYKYFEELALGPECPIPTHGGRHVWMTLSAQLNENKRTLSSTI